MNADSGLPLHSLKVDGGMTNSEAFMQIQSDVLRLNVHRPLMRETTALGAALAAGIGSGLWQSWEDIAFSAEFESFHPRSMFLCVICSIYVLTSTGTLFMNSRRIGQF